MVRLVVIGRYHGTDVTCECLPPYLSPSCHLKFLCSNDRSQQTTLFQPSSGPPQNPRSAWFLPVCLRYAHSLSVSFGVTQAYPVPDKVGISARPKPRPRNGWAVAKYTTGISVGCRSLERARGQTMWLYMEAEGYKGPRRKFWS